MNFDSLQFEMRISANEIFNINRSVFHVVADEDGEATTTTTRPIPSKKSITGKNWIRRLRAEFSFLDTRDFDVVGVEERRKLISRCVDPIDVNLKNTWSWSRWRRTRRTTRSRSWRRRPRIGLDARDEEEKKDEPTRKRV